MWTAVWKLSAQNGAKLHTGNQQYHCKFAEKSADENKG